MLNKLKLLYTTPHIDFYVHYLVCVPCMFKTNVFCIAITSNYKGVLQEFLAKRGLSNPSYSTVQSCSRLFVSTISLKDLSGKPIQLQGKGYSKKKDAEQSAAKQACIYYELVN